MEHILPRVNATKPLKGFGGFREMRIDKSPNFPSIRDHINKLSKVEAVAVHSYLTNAPELFEWLSPVRDPLDSDLMIPSVTYSDGVFVWDSMLAHFVITYQIDLPEVFLDFIYKFDGKYDHFADVNISEVRARYPTVNTKNEKRGIDISYFSYP